jgi:predicted RNA binding protein YcfA (HicA-like mRNA interferase family)
VSNPFPALKAAQLLRVLRSLGYEVQEHRGGSHRWLRARGRPDLRWAFHDGVTIGPVMVRRILVRDVGLDVDEALEVVRRG